MLLAVLATFLLVNGCSHRGDGAESEETTPTEASVRGSTTTTVESTETAILAAYRAFWDVYKAASNPMNPGDPRLADVAMGDEFAQLTKAFAARLDLHEVFMGNLDLRPTVTTVEGEKATVLDCMFDGLGVYDTTTNPPTRKDQPDTNRTERTTTMQLAGGRWKVAYVGPKGGRCEAER